VGSHGDLNASASGALPAPRGPGLRHGLDELVVDGAYDPQPAESAIAPSGALAAVFAEVRIDQDLGVPRLARLTSVIAGGSPCAAGMASRCSAAWVSASSRSCCSPRAPLGWIV
jgi:CO/xanthine dehydrogenase Mo-binding subunit